MEPVRSISLVNTDPSRAYRRAFEDFSQRVRQVQSLTAHPSPDRTAIDEALLELERARVAYNVCRDALAQQLLPSSIPAVAEYSPDAYADHVKAIAELLWEGCGRPAGTADDDWRRAEEIVRRAAAAA